VPDAPGQLVFLSHAGEDLQEAGHFAEVLRHNGVNVWLDREQLQPGDEWISEIEQAILQSSAMIVYVGKRGVQSWVDREMRLGLERSISAPDSFRLVPVLGEGSDPAALPPFLRQQQYADLRDRNRAPEEIRRLVRILSTSSSEPAFQSGYWATHSPFRSLQTFEPGDSWLFFGRDHEVDSLLAAMARAPVLAVLGNSGSGKSSLVRAGLIPALRRGRGHISGVSVKSWQIAVFRPSSAPFDELAEAVFAQFGLEAHTSIEELKTKFATDANALRNAIVTGVGSSELGDCHHILLVADQFEELFTLSGDSAFRRKYVELLLRAIRSDSAVSVHLVIVMRSDFYSYALDYPGLSRCLEENLFNVPRMQAAQLRETIEKRLALASARAEPGLIDALLEDVGDEPGDLALLEHALDQLWARRSGRESALTNAAYTAIGRLRGALGRHADEAIESFSDAKQAQLVKRIFLELVQLGEGVQDTRRRVPKEDMLRLGPRQQVELVLARLASSRLIATSRRGVADYGQDVVEVSHEALIREWPTLQKWVDENRVDLRLERNLVTRGEEWVSLKKDSGALLRGALLQQAEEWASTHTVEADSLKQLLEASVAARDLEVLRAKKATERELNQQKELHNLAERRAEAERQLREEADRSALIQKAAAIRANLSAKRNRRLSLLLGVSVMIAIGFAYSSSRETSLAESRELSAWAAVGLGDDPERSLTLGLLAWNKQKEMVGGLEAILHDAVLGSAGRLTLSVPSGRLVSVAWSPDGSKLATAGTEPTAIVWDAITGRQLVRLTGHRDAVESITWSPDGTELATASADRSAKVWDAATGRELASLQGHTDQVWDVAWSMNGKALATASLDDTAKIWDPTSGKELRTLRGHKSRVVALAWSPRKANELATASYDKTAKIWDTSSGQELVTLAGHADTVGSVAWSGDGTRIATASADRTASVWDATTGRVLMVLRGHQNQVWSVQWSPDSKKLATGSADSTAKVWDSAGGRELQTLRGLQGGVESVAWSPDGAKLATAGVNQNARIWELGPGRELLTLRENGRPVLGVAWSADGKRIATANEDGMAHIRDANTGRELASLSAHDRAVNSIAWAPDGGRVATGSSDGTARIWSSDGGRALLVLEGDGSEVHSVAWSPDGTQVATASKDNTAKLWDAHTGRQLRNLAGHSKSVNSVAWSPDGSRLATASNDQTVRIWETKTGREIEVLKGHRLEVECVAWSPDGRRVASASGDHTARIWTPGTKGVALVLSGHLADVQGVAWTRDGTKLATASSDQTTRVWDTSSGRELLTLGGHEGEVLSVAWPPDGKTLASAGADGITQIYAIDRIELLRLVRARITRSLTPEECQRYMNGSRCPALPTVP
jgi:WD40 repeat protein